MQPLNRGADCVSNLELDEWLAGELSAHDEQRVLQHMANCELCQQRRTDLERESAKFFAAAPSFRDHAERFRQGSAGSAQLPAAERLQGSTQGVHSGVDGASSSRRPARTTIALGAAAVAMAALVALMVRPSQPSATRAKGDPHIGFFVKREGTVKRGANGDTVYPNDLVRFVYTSDRAYHFAIFNLDARAATVYFPAGAQAEQVFAGNDVPLDFSVQLDEQLGTERIVALFCPDTFAIQPLRAALGATAELPSVPARCHRDVITLNKVVRP